ncbi:hypothetical protein NPIL_567291 [Nephila pilipes]|uniref:Uncharacterized protein n=1 Tax=Nephila pilipes TaxID=299642 RepID=A0A8X6P0M4_NEPPI|nr:hypothetical protein NPIL_567291 [Nephila pilipes]
MKLAYPLWNLCPKTSIGVKTYPWYLCTMSISQLIIHRECSRRFIQIPAYVDGNDITGESKQAVVETFIALHLQPGTLD